MSDTTEKPTTKAVVKYAEKLREQAERQMAADPYAQPYYPTTAAARTLVKRIANQRERDTRARLEGQEPAVIDAAVADARAEAPRLAIDKLRERAAKADGEYRRAELESERNLARHRRRQAQHTRDVSARRADKTLGARLDEALAGLLTIATTSAAPLGGDRVQGGEKASSPPWNGDPHGHARGRAYKLVQEIEGMLDTARVRDVQKAA